jgi:hypothetical protein
VVVKCFRSWNSSVALQFKLLNCLGAFCRYAQCWTKRIETQQNTFFPENRPTFEGKLADVHTRTSEAYFENLQ